MQQDLYNKYYTLNGEVVAKTNKIKESLPELNAKIKRKEEKLKLSKFMFNYTIYYINA